MISDLTQSRLDLIEKRKREKQAYTRRIELTEAFNKIINHDSKRTALQVMFSTINRAKKAGYLENAVVSKRYSIEDYLPPKPEFIELDIDLNEWQYTIRREKMHEYRDLESLSQQSFIEDKYEKIEDEIVKTPKPQNPN